MQIEKEDILLLQCAYYFVSRHQYRFIQVKTVGKEIWLANGASEFPVIHLTAQSYESSFFDAKRVGDIYRAISAVLKTDTRLLNIHISQEEINDFDSEFIETSLFEGHISGFDVSAKFPDVMSCFYTSGNISRDYLEIARKIDKVGKAGLKEDRKKLMKANILGQIPKVSGIIAVICIAVYLLALLLSIKYDDITAAILLGGYYKGFVFINHEFWRFLTAGFVHISFTHLLMNMISLVNLGQLTEKVYGAKRYLLILLGSIISGSAFVYILDGNTLCVGISGGLYGLLAATLVYLVQTKLINHPQIMKNILYLVVINLLINVMPGVSTLGHMGGFIGGLIISFVVYPDKSFDKMKKNAVLVLVLFCAMIFYKCAQVKDLDQIYVLTDLDVVEVLESLPVDFYTDRLSQNLMEYYIKEGLMK